MLRKQGYVKELGLVAMCWPIPLEVERSAAFGFGLVVRKKYPQSQIEMASFTPSLRIRLKGFETAKP